MGWEGRESDGWEHEKHKKIVVYEVEVAIILREEKSVKIQEVVTKRERKRKRERRCCGDADGIEILIEAIASKDKESDRCEKKSFTSNRRAF